MSTNDTTGKGKPFFDRADQLADVGNWDYAIEMYLQGIAREPNEIQRGHEKLREAALRRKASGGKGPGLMDGLKHKASKDPLTSLSNAEFLMGRDPGNVAYWKQILSAARSAELSDVAKWAGSILFEINRTIPKPSKEVYALLTDTYTAMGLYGEARQACQAALAMDPNNATISDALRNLSAQETITKGRYDEEGSFTKSVKDLKGQIDLAKKDQITQNVSYREEQVLAARAAYEAEPTEAGKITALVEALIKFDDEAYENEAIDVLAKALKDSGTYRYKMRIGDIKIRQMERRSQKLLKAGDKAGAIEQAKQQLAFELEEYTERAANYPTDLGLKYELGRRQLKAGKYDESISLLQQARRDPKHRVLALINLGAAFAKKGWMSEAAETLEQALQTELTEQRIKDVKYNLGLVYRTMGRLEDAMQQFSDVAQIDINYKDVRKIIEELREELRKRKTQGTAGQGPSTAGEDPH